MKTNSVHFFNDIKTKTVCDNCELVLAFEWNRQHSK